MVSENNPAWIEIILLRDHEYTKANLTLYQFQNFIEKEILEDGTQIRSGTQLQEAHYDQQIEGTYNTRLKK